MTDRQNRRRRHKRHKARTALGPFRKDYPRPQTLMDSFQENSDSRVLRWRSGKFPTWWIMHNRLASVISIFQETSPMVGMMWLAPVEA